MTKSLYDQMRGRFKGGELFRKEEDRLQPKYPWDYVENVSIGYPEYLHVKTVLLQICCSTVDIPRHH